MPNGSFKSTSTGASLDQRGISRPQDQPGTANLNGSDGSDIGAFEFNTAAAGYAQKWLQIPDTTPNGYAVQASMPTMLADDFRCTATGPITQVRLWGSWRYHDVAPAPCFRLGIWSDVPGQPGTNSHPGIQLCEFYFSPGQYTNRIYLQGTTEWFLDPNFPEFVGTDTNIWEYIFDLPASPPCWQTNGNIYWLSLAAECFEVGPTMFGGRRWSGSCAIIQNTAS